MGKARDGSECYTRQGNSGTYVTCEGTQKGGKSSGSSASKSKPMKKGFARRTGSAPGQPKPAPKPKPQTGKARRTGGPPGQTGFARRTGGAPGQKPKAKPKAQAVKVVKGTRKSIDLEATDKSKPVAKGKGGFPFQQKQDGIQNRPKVTDLLDDFNKKIGITRQPKKGEYITVLSTEPTPAKPKVTYIQGEKALLKAMGYDSKKYEPLSKAQLTRIKKFTGDSGVFLSPIADVSGISSTSGTGKPGIKFQVWMPMRTEKSGRYTIPRRVASQINFKRIKE